MSKKWTYLFALVLLALVAVIVYAAVHIPGLQRQSNNDKQALGRLSVVAIKVMPDSLSEYPVALSFDPAVDQSGATVSYTVETNPEAQMQINEAVVSKLDNVQINEAQSLGIFIEDGYRYTVSVTPTANSAIVVIVENGPVAQ